MTEYSLRRDDDDNIAFKIEAVDTEDAIAQMKIRMRALGGDRHEGDWTLSLVERVEYPELNDTLDIIGPFHLIFVHQCSLDSDGTIYDDDDSVWDENTDMTFDSGYIDEH